MSGWLEVIQEFVTKHWWISNIPSFSNLHMENKMYVIMSKIYLYYLYIYTYQKWKVSTKNKKYTKESRNFTIKNFLSFSYVQYFVIWEYSIWVSSFFIFFSFWNFWYSFLTTLKRKFNSALYFHLLKSFIMFIWRKFLRKFKKILRVFIACFFIIAWLYEP